MLKEKVSRTVTVSVVERPAAGGSLPKHKVWEQL